MNKEELQEFRDYIRITYDKDGEYGNLEQICDGSIKNATRTSDRYADKGVSWINYWRALAGDYDNELTCSSCGQKIVAEIPLHEFLFGEGNVTQAVGGHVWIPGTNDYKGGRYITPLCPACNAKRGEYIPILKGSKFVKELGANVKDED